MGSSLIFTLLGLWAATPLSEVEIGPLGAQRQIGVDERLPRVLELLATESGAVAPMLARPFPAGRAFELVQRLRASHGVALWEGGPTWWDAVRGPLSLSAAEVVALRQQLRSFSVLANDRAALQLALFGGPEVYARTSAVDTGPQWRLGFKERAPMLGLDAQFAWHLFADIQAWGHATADLKQDQTLYTTPRARRVATNAVPPEAIDSTFPHRAIVGIGGSSFGLDLGRDRIDLGNGRMGNLLLGDAADFVDFARAQLFLPVFTWTSLVVRLDPVLLDDEPDLPGMDQLRSHDKHLVVHRAELVLFDKLHLAASEGLLVGGVPLDLRHLNPLLVFHNLFPWDQVAAYRAGSILATFEATLVPIRGLRLWGQLGLNQLQTPLERGWYPESAGVIPDATGRLGGVEFGRALPLFVPHVTSWVTPGGVLHLFAGVEAGQTDPWFGVRENPLVTWSSRRRLPSNLTGGTAVVEQPLGWRFGPDSRVWRVWVGGLDVGLGEVELGFEERVHGEQTLRSAYEETPAAVALATPTGIAETQRILGVQAELWPLRLERTTVRLRLDWRHFWIEGARHVEGARLVDDQLVLGVQLRL